MIFVGLSATLYLASENTPILEAGQSAPFILFAALFAIGIAFMEGGRRAFLGAR